MHIELEFADEEQHKCYRSGHAFTGEEKQKPWLISL